jgi:lipopolysaccharide/colanic/teichoic acid biosynthesis glycosyltransferase
LTRRPPALRTLIIPPASAHARRAERVKAVVDYPLAALLLLTLSPVVLLAMLAVKLTSRGPALYTQARVGRGGRVFTIYKIRTMYHECESLTGPRWSMPGDPRITPIGKLFRALHIDELPQLWNVLKGDMALIGPRPERPEICKQLRQVIPGYDKRHAVRPGITGFAQVHLPPDSNLRSVRNKVAYDRFYILRLGVRTELYVYACTALKLLGLRGLYRRPPRKPAGE